MGVGAAKGGKPKKKKKNSTRRNWEVTAILQKQDKRQKIKWKIEYCKPVTSYIAELDMVNQMTILHRISKLFAFPI